MSSAKGRLRLVPNALRAGQERHGRRGAVFCVRMTDEERARLQELQSGEGPRALGPWLLWRALGDPTGNTRARAQAGNTRPGGASAVLPARAEVPFRKRLILDLCAGSGAWSAPYKRAGYRVVRVTLPRHDVCTFVSPRARVWGVLCAPPCQEFSLARNGGRKPRDFAAGMACVNACLRLVLQTRPTWWALENPVGKLSVWLGTPRDVFEPCDFGDPWTKRTAVWGDFAIPARGPFVKPAAGKTRLTASAAERAVTPSGFARAFFEANP